MTRSAPVGALVLLLLLLLAPAVNAGEWRGAGSPLTLVAEGTVHGSVFASGGHGYTQEQPYTEYLELPPGQVTFARLSVPVWNYNEADTLDVSVNGQALPQRTWSDIVSAWGVASYLFDVTGLVHPGMNRVEARYRNDNGAPYAVFLTAVVENQSMPVTRFFVYEGNSALAPGTKLDREIVGVNATVETGGLERATLVTMQIAGTAGERDRLLFNDHLLGEDVGRAKSGPYLDIDTFDVTPLVNRTGNRVVFERGDENYLHPFNVVLVLTYADGAGVPVTGVSSRLVEHARGREVPLPVIAVLVLSVLGAAYLYRIRRRSP
ncbi:MAG TPA: DUF3344 domain-containing protein [Methanoregulaceae archaeon]|nr:DUF3344 domain-containing protein [Methanoregulaceae archaeon]